MKSITKYQANNGQVFNTEREAMSEDVREKIRNLVDEKAYRGMDNESIADMILDNSKQFKQLLTELEGLQSEKQSTWEFHGLAAQGNVDHERSVITGNRAV